MSKMLINWQVQIKKGYLELCILMLLLKQKRLYGGAIIDALGALSIPIKEGTLYPLLKRMVDEGVLKAEWVTENNSGHPRKYYTVTEQGEQTLQRMTSVFADMAKVFENLKVKI